MFHLPVDLAHASDGNIAVLDKLKHSVFIYTPEGEFIRSVGREGDGPGEFRMPSTIEYDSKGFLYIQDQIAIEIYDTSYTYIDLIERQYPSPFMIRIVDSGGLVGAQCKFSPGEQGIAFSNTLGRWDEDDTASVEYTSICRDFDPSDGEIDLSESRESTLYSCATGSGRVFCSQSSVDEYHVIGYEPNGSEFLYIEDPDFQRVLKSDREIQFEIDWWENLKSYASATSDPTVKPDPFRQAILGMFTVGEDELWVRLGVFEGIVFRVYDMTGEIQYHVMLDYPGDPAELKSWTVVGSEHGFLAYQTMPEYYPRIYILQLKRYEVVWIVKTEEGVV